ncbi:MAG TPA: branched-chain amino acid ABC transporter substrate-binding protein, partial [Solirubrobacteraceae bacterium]
MLTRWLGLAALAAAVAAAAGCGGSAVSATNEAVGGPLSIYSSLPLQGPNALISQQTVGGEKLALAAVGGRVGRFKIGYVSLDDSNPTNPAGGWSTGATASNAKIAAQDPSTIAYIGDYNSQATAISLFPINEAGIAQVSPSSPYVGLTASLDAGQDEPERFYPTGKRNFARLGPGDPMQASAQIALTRSLGVHKLYVLDDQDPFQLPLAQIVAGDAARAGISVAGQDSISMSAGAVYTGEVEKIVQSGAQAVFVSSAASEGAAQLLVQLHAADPHLLLLGPSTMVEDETFAPQLGAAASSTYLTTPVLPTYMYSAEAQRVLADYSRRFGGEASAYVLYGYESMRLVINAIRRAGSRGNDRQTVVERLFGTHDRESVLGRYSIEPDGESTLST